MEKPKKIYLIPSAEIRYEEGIADDAITPGMLVQINATGGERHWKRHAVAGGDGERLFAIEDSLQGKTIDDVYAAGSLVRAVAAHRGDVIYGILNAGENVAVGDFLISDGNGTLKKTTGTPEHISVALEALDLRDSDLDNTHIRMRIV